MRTWSFVSCGHGVLGHGGLLPPLRCPTTLLSATSSVLVAFGDNREGSSSPRSGQSYSQDLLLRIAALCSSKAPKTTHLSAFPQCAEKISSDSPHVLLR